MKNMLRLAAFALSLPLVFWSCKDDPDTTTGSVEIRFKAEYDGVPLQTFTQYDFSGNQHIEFSHLSLMITEVALIDGSFRQELDDVELVNLSYSDATQAANGYSMLINNVEARTYDTITFTIGVPRDWNAMKPVDFPSANPLSNAGYFWNAWSSYIFTKSEGKLDADGDGTQELNFALHTGSDPLLRILSAPVPISVQDGLQKDLEIVIDYKDLLGDVNIAASPQNHNPADTAQILKITDNFANAITLYQ